MSEINMIDMYHNDVSNLLFSVVMYSCFILKKTVGK
jgi:hypothetical protein